MDKLTEARKIINSVDAEMAKLFCRRMAAVKDVQVEDLLGREPVKLDTAVLLNFLQGQTVLVTGGEIGRAHV